MRKTPTLIGSDAGSAKPAGANGPDPARASTRPTCACGARRKGIPILRFVVHGIAQPAGSKKGFYNQRTGRVQIVDAAKKSRPWKALVTDAAAEAMNGAELLRGPLSVTFAFYMPRPKGHHGKRGILPSAPPYPITRPDALKLARAVEDGLNGVCYFDDAQIVEELLVKRYGEPARCEITVAPMPLGAAMPVPSGEPGEQTSLLATGEEAA